MGTTWFDQGLERGMQQGLERGEIEGKRKAAASVLEARFGPLSRAAREWVERWPAEDLDQLIGRVALAQSLAELGLPGRQEDG